ncbi:MAG TPA: protein kinase [Blastocatellia bacterium]|nr:protein kinase [Blastocatellia bacterium]
MIGEVLGSYKIVEKIGEGGMGAVYRGFDEMLEREVAIKMLRPELASQPEVVERFRTEAITLAKLNHPNIATLYSFLRNGEDYFMVMEFVRGDTLDDVIRKFGAMSVERAVPLFCQALEGIDHAHRMGIVHRDLKPANVMLTDTSSIKVMDFGIARVLGTARMTRQGNIVGTIEYMSPEQVRGLESDARSDVYSLGIVLYEMLTGRVPFNADSEFELMKAQVEQAPAPPRSFATHIPLPVEHAIMRSLAKKPEARYQNAGEFRSILMGTLGATTNLLDKKPATYAAPVTRAMDIPIPEGTIILTEEPPDTSKHTRVSGSPDQPVVTAKQDKLTSAVAGNTGKAARAETVVQAASPEAAHTSISQPQASARGKLNGKHYIAAALVLLVLIGVPLGWMATRQTPVTPEPTAPQTAPDAETPPAEPAANSTAEVPAEPTDNANESANLNANASRSARSRNARNESVSNENASDATTPPVTQPVPVDTPPVVAQQPPTPPIENKNVSAQAGNKNEAKAQAKKGGGVGGFFKKIFGGGEKKNDNKNKKP